MKTKYKFTKEFNKELRRQNFWYFIMIHFPKLYAWCEKYLKCDTLPF